MISFKSYSQKTLCRDRHGQRLSAIQFGSVPARFTSFKLNMGFTLTNPNLVNLLSKREALPIYNYTINSVINCKISVT